MSKMYNFFKGLRATYVVLLGLSVAEMLKIKVDIVTFTFIFFMVGFSLDVLVENAYIKRALRGRKKKNLKVAK